MGIRDFRLHAPEALFIGGKWLPPANGRRIQIVHPATGELALEVAQADKADVHQAVTAARKAFDTGPWPRMRLAERAEYLEAFAAALERRSEELAHAYSTEIGIPIGASRHMVGSAGATLRSVIALARDYPFAEERLARGGVARVVREPVGVVAAIVPWNYPAMLGLLKIGPALLSGCSVVAKPSPEAPLDLLLIAECSAEAGLPEGVLSVITADRDVGDSLIRDERIDKVSFTGSTAAGKHIAAVCMSRVARVSLELGGKSAAIVLDDAPLQSVVPALVAMSTLISGQACMALTRVLVSRERSRELTGALAAAYSSLRLGDPFDPATQMGPLASLQQRQRVERHIAQGRAEGARLVTGGGRPTHLARGYFLEPTVFAGVDNEMTIAQEEIFGPVLSVIEYESVDEAVAIANSSPYGLNSAVFTRDEDLFVKLAAQIRAGTVAHNAIGPQAGLPFGGYKQSGFGRENSVEAFDLYTEIKTIYVQRSSPPN